MSVANTRDRLRRLAEESIGSVDGGYLRPWMCRNDPTTARVLLVGANPATPFPVEAIDREDYLDGLVSDGDRLRAPYLALRGGMASPTRDNIDRLVEVFHGAGVGTILETNVWTLPTRSLDELRRAGGTKRARSTMLPALVEVLSPVAIVVHGAKATNGLAELLDRAIGPASTTSPVRWHDGEPVIVSIPSLSPPPANAWLPKAHSTLEELGADLARYVRGTGS
jgi:hypothetical protein